MKALNKVYGMSVVCDAPYADRAELQGNDVVLYFNACQRLKLKSTGIDCIQLISEDGKIKIKSAIIQGNKLILKTDEAGDKLKLSVHFADSPYHNVNLYNEADLPAKPFVIKIK